jgi:zinc transport system substrate-binding protein
MRTAGALLMGLVIAGCGRDAASAPHDRLSAFVGIPPLADFVQRIGGGHVAVEVLIPPGQSPHSFTPTPHQIARLADADICFFVGLPFERALMQRLGEMSGRVRIVDASRGVPLLFMNHDHSHAAHRSDQSHERERAVSSGAGALASALHGSETPDPHIWLDPDRAQIIAGNIAEGLATVDAQHAVKFRERLATVRSELQTLDRDLTQTLAPLHGQPFLAFHPAYGYFADAYGLRQVAVEIEGKRPGGRTLARVIRLARREGIHTVFYRPQLDGPRARVIANEIDGTAAPLDPLACDYFGNLRRMAEQIRAAKEATQ